MEAGKKTDFERRMAAYAAKLIAVKKKNKK
jgi:hypothetical protein